MLKDLPIDRRKFFFDVSVRSSKNGGTRETLKEDFIVLSTRLVNFHRHPQTPSYLTLPFFYFTTRVRPFRCCYGLEVYRKVIKIDVTCINERIFGKFLGNITLKKSIIFFSFSSFFSKYVRLFHMKVWKSNFYELSNI